jgi:hypothetical protein
MRRWRLVSGFGLGILVVGGLGLVAAVGPAQAATGTPLPAHVFAPYFEAWTGDNPATLSQRSGARYLTMAFPADGEQGFVHSAVERRRRHAGCRVDVRRRDRHDPLGRR